MGIDEFLKDQDVRRFNRLVFAQLFVAPLLKSGLLGTERDYEDFLDMMKRTKHEITKVISKIKLQETMA